MPINKGSGIALAVSAFLLLVGAAQIEAAVIFDNFDVGDGRQPSGGHTLARGNANAGFDVDSAMNFTPSGSDFFLDEIELAVTLLEGPNELDVWIARTEGGSPGSIIEPFHFSNAIPPNPKCFLLPGGGVSCDPSSNPLLIAQSALNPRLQAGTPYWLVASPSDQGTWAAWNLNTINDLGPVAQRINGSDWTVVDEVQRGAFRVSGTIVPEPSSLFLLSFGLLGLAGWRRRFRS